jgi:hypothetical protein
MITSDRGIYSYQPSVNQRQQGEERERALLQNLQQTGLLEAVTEVRDLLGKEGPPQ